jgi:hypothetical protein
MPSSLMPHPIALKVTGSDLWARLNPGSSAYYLGVQQAVII